MAESKYCTVTGNRMARTRNKAVYYAMESLQNDEKRFNAVVDQLWHAHRLRVIKNTRRTKEVTRIEIRASLIDQIDYAIHLSSEYKSDWYEACDRVVSIRCLLSLQDRLWSCRYLISTGYDGKVWLPPMFVED